MEFFQYQSSASCEFLKGMWQYVPCPIRALRIIALSSIHTVFGNGLHNLCHPKNDLSSTVVFGKLIFKFCGFALYST